MVGQDVEVEKERKEQCMRDRVSVHDGTFQVVDSSVGTHQVASTVALHHAYLQTSIRLQTISVPCNGPIRSSSVLEMRFKPTHWPEPSK